MSVMKGLRDIGSVLDIDCGDNSCYFKARGDGGMRTNGGCRCDLAHIVRAQRDKYAALVGAVQTFSGWYGECGDREAAAFRAMDDLAKEGT